MGHNIAQKKIYPTQSQIKLGPSSWHAETYLGSKDSFHKVHAEEANKSITVIYGRMASNEFVIPIGCEFH